MWQVKIEDEAYETLESGELTKSDLEVIHQWAKLVNEDGPAALQMSPQIWADHELYDEWKGYRASSFSYKGRIIYKVKEKIVTVTVVRITAEHDYKKEKE